MVQRRLMTSSPGHGANTWWSISKGFTVTLKEKFKKQSYRMKFTKTQNNLKLQKNHLLLIAHHENLNALFQENWIKAVAKIVSPFLHANVIKYATGKLRFESPLYPAQGYVCETSRAFGLERNVTSFHPNILTVRKNYQSQF